MAARVDYMPVCILRVDPFLEGTLGYIETCDKCGGDVRIIASIEDPIVLTHLNNKLSSVAIELPK